MQSLWTDAEASQYKNDLEMRVYTSRLLGRDPSLVLHGGGNTSVKIRETNILGKEEDILYVKGSGWDLATIEAPGFSPVRMQHLIELAELTKLTDPEMVNELKTHMTKASAPTPSVEAILHATLPYKFVDHTHADAIVTVTNNPNGRRYIEEIYGDSVVVIDYIMPGFDLARQCAKQFAQQAHAGTLGMVLMNHGIFSFAETARESYERMIALVKKAEEFIQRHNAWELTFSARPLVVEGLQIAALRKDLSEAAGFAVVLFRDNGDKATAFSQRGDLAQISQQGPATPDHVIRTKPVPMLGNNVQSFVEKYRTYFNANEPNARDRKTILDVAPRVVIDPQLGLLTIGKNAKEAAIVRDIYDHTIDIILRAEKLGGYRALPEQDIFDMEYWDLEQAKLRAGGKAPMFTGEVALVTGAASGIGKACVDSLLSRGAAVIALDINDKIVSLYQRADFLGLVCDVSDETQLSRMIEEAVKRFGGIDMLVLNAGVFPGGKKISELGQEEFQRVMRINLDANVSLLHRCYPYLKLAPNGGRVVLMGSKNVPAPGPGAAAYSASKAALTQIGRIAAMEWGADNIRVNMLHPDAVFDTGIWTEEVLAARAKHYGLSVEQYKRKNVLRTEVSSRDVAELVAEMCGPLFAKTTAAQLPVDGGNDRVI
ncbi:MAG: bifunctional aldolase/short-chain dehydrogenase [Gammaproteobacteria bacterium]|nr:bifunctional aldolase/short-chain dehydrogenase [Gammaproteobacteria bacterium]